MVTRLLKELCVVKRGEALPIDYKTGDYPIIGHDNYGEKCDQFNVLRDSLIIYRSGMTMGYVDRHESKTFVTENCYYLDEINEQVNKEFLYYYLTRIKKDLYEIGRRYNYLSIEDVQNLQIRLPSIDKQEMFAYRISSRNLIINELKKQMEVIEKQLKNARIDADEIIDEEMKKWIVKIEIPLRPLPLVRTDGAETLDPPVLQPLQWRVVEPSSWDDLPPLVSA